MKDWKKVLFDMQAIAFNEAVCLKQINNFNIEILATAYRTWTNFREIKFRGSSLPANNY